MRTAMAIGQPRCFKRGPDFNIVLVLPSYVPAAYFSEYTGTAQLRRYKDDSENGFIADITFEWIEPEDARAFRLINTDTVEWPLGLAEIDVLLENPEGKKVGTATILLKIERSITRDAP